MEPDKYIPGTLFNFEGKTFMIGEKDNIFEYYTDFTIDPNSTITTINSDSAPFSSDYCYKQIFINLCDNNIDKKAEYETLLKLNNNDYRVTVLQIEYNEDIIKNELL